MALWRVKTADRRGPPQLRGADHPNFGATQTEQTGGAARHTDYSTVATAPSHLSKRPQLRLSHASSGRVIALCCGCSALGRRAMVSRLSSGRRRSRPQLSACGLGLELGFGLGLGFGGLGYLTLTLTLTLTKP